MAVNTQKDKLTIQLPSSLKAKFKAKADKNMTTVSQIGRKLIADFCAK